MKYNILFLCSGNSCRSQMAEGWANALLTEKVNAYSAGISPQELNPRAVKAMAEVGIDISKHYSKSIESLSSVNFDLVITVCDNAADSCPTPPKETKVIHMPFEDPPKLAINASNEDEAMAHYHRIRDEIKSFIINLPQLLY